VCSIPYISYPNLLNFDSGVRRCNTATCISPSLMHLVILSLFGFSLSHFSTLLIHHQAVYSTYITSLFLMVPFDPNCLVMCWTDFHQIFRVGRNMGGDDQYDIRFVITQWPLLR